MAKFRDERVQGWLPRIEGTKKYEVTLKGCTVSAMWHEKLSEIGCTTMYIPCTLLSWIFKYVQRSDFRFRVLTTRKSPWNEIESKANWPWVVKHMTWDINDVLHNRTPEICVTLLTIVTTINWKKKKERKKEMQRGRGSERARWWRNNGSNDNKKQRRLKGSREERVWLSHRQIKKTTGQEESFCLRVVKKMCAVFAPETWLFPIPIQETATWHLRSGQDWAHSLMSHSFSRPWNHHLPWEPSLCLRMQL